VIFVVVGDNDVVILKAISPPSIKEFDGLIAEARVGFHLGRFQKNDIKNNQ